ncbi:TPA: ABC transporter permease subunit [Stenotrophomonas maltophilia]
MILNFFRFELREQLRSPLLWLLAGLFALLAFAAASSDAVQIGGGSGNVHSNAPTVIAQMLGIFTLLGMLVTALFVSNALLRDFELGTAELIFASPVKRRDYLAGRIAAALAAGLLVYIVIAFGLWLAPFMPWIDPERMGPISWQGYAWTFAVIVIPNLLFTTALLSLLAALTRSILWVYIGLVAYLVLYGASAALLRDIDNTWIAVLSEPLGMRALSRTIRYWSTAERNSGIPELAGYLLANRALWLGVAAALFAATFALFRTERSGSGRRRWGRRQAQPVADASAVRPTRATLPRVVPAFTATTAWQQFLRQVRFDTRGVLRSVPFIVLLVLGLANFLPSALFRQTLYGTSIWPVTSQMIMGLQGAFSWLLVIIVLFFAGELVWKERSARINEVTDAMPVPNWVPLLAKFTALLAVIVCFQAAGALAAMGVQLAKGYTHLEPLLYLRSLALDSVVYILMGGLALVLQVLTNNKFVGYALLIVVMIGQGVLGLLDYTQNLYNFGSWPNAPYSDMNGYGHFLTGQLAFQGYWALFLLTLMCLASAFWVRGVSQGLRQRLALAGRRLRGPTGAFAAVAALAFVGVGSWLYWSTNIRNEFLSPDQQLDLQARYERELSKYRNLPQPRIVAVDNRVDLFPESQSMVIDANWTIRNLHAQPIPELHVSMGDDKQLVAADLGGQTMAFHDKDLGYRIYRLDKPLQPGESRRVHFRVVQKSNGITAGQAPSNIVGNGTFFNSRVLPSFGYNEGAEITDRNERRKRDLGEPRRMPKLEDEAARANTYIANDADWLDFRTTICTAPDQVALAPGYLQHETTVNGRRCFSYAMDRPMLNFYAYLSARWEVRKAKYKDIPIEVYFEPAHGYNVDRMIEAVQKSLAYYEANFTPYQHRQVRIIEFPGYARFARDDGRYDVTLDLHAAKQYADGKGKESDGKMDDWVEIGVFANGPSGKERDQKVLYLQRHHITSAAPKITVTVDEKPDEAGFDPYNKLIDRVSDDNRRKVTL